MKRRSTHDQDYLRHKEQEESKTSYEAFMRESKPFFEAFEKETDRGLAIASVCFLDDALEKLIRATYRKEPGVKTLFKNNQILQPFFNKVCIAYFSGLIPKAVYDDLKLVGEIRNKFAHSVLETRSLDDVSIAKKIDMLEQLPPEVKKEYPPRLKFLLVVVHMGSFLRGMEGLKESGPMKIRVMCDTDVATLRGCILKPSKIKELSKRASKKKGIPSKEG